MLPSDLTLHFIRVRPVPSCFLPHSRTSSSSPGFSFRVTSLIFRASSLLASMSKLSVRMVSLITLQTTPSFRNTLPWLPAIVMKPSTPSCIVRALTRWTSVFSSFTGASNACTISPTSRRRSDLASLIARPSVMATSFITFISTMSIASNASLGTEPSFSSSKWAKARVRSSSDMASASAPAFASLPTKAAKASGPKEPDFFVSMASNSAAAVRPSAAWCAFMSFSALADSSLTSTRSFFAASARSFSTAAVARCSCASKFAARFFSLPFSPATHFVKSFSTSSPSQNSPACVFATSTFSEADLISAASSSARAAIAGDFRLRVSEGRAFV
mmetsp:Transcript_80829/g.247010  ORF Transcript_80829/g.247010 Transcript_80829/m.247010 type:complete len:331 (-) Transcript_80829:498-1490(-)